MTQPKPAPPGDDPDALWAELERLRAATQELRDDLATTQRKLDRRDAELREARTQTRLAVRAREDAAAARAQLADRDRLAQESQQAARHARAAAARARRDYDRLRGRRLVRLALRLAEVARPAFQRWRTIRSAGLAPMPPALATATPAPDPATLAAGHADALATLVRASLPPAPAATGPSVTAIVLNRSGADHLRRLLPALERTAYDRLDVVVVDNASTDDSLAVLDAFMGRLPLTVVRNDHNASFSDGNNQGADASSGDYLLLLNNDVEPIEPHWLARMVATAEETGAAAVGARLVYPNRPGLDNAGDTVHPDLTLQHRGIHFAHGPDGMPLPRNVGGGDDPLAPVVAARRDVPAATAACLLVRREAWQTVGGLASGYVYGSEDVDLCLALRRQGGAIVYDGTAVLWHHEFGTQNREGRDFKAANRRANRQLFVDRWGPALYREVLADRVRGRGWWSHDPLRVRVEGHLDLGGTDWDAVPAASDGGGDAVTDVVVVTAPETDLSKLPRQSVRVGWLAADTDVEQWCATAGFEDLDLVLAADATAASAVAARSGHHPQVRTHGLPAHAQLRDALLAWLEATRWTVLIATPSREEAPWWGDTHYARDFRQALEAQGAPTRIALRDEEDAAHLSASDVVVHILGLTEHRPRAGQVSVLWNISHPELMRPELCDRYDLVLTAAPALRAELEQQITTPVAELHQATAPRRFHPTPGGPEHDLLFVANSRRQRRAIIDALVPTTFDLAIYGREWFDDLVDPRHVRGALVPNEELAAYYTAAAIVLNDHWPEMRSAGIISNRLYDALAAGAFVVSDGVPGLADEFDDAVVTFTDRADLQAAITHYLAAPDERRETAQRGRKAVLARHTFSHRVETILELLDGQLATHRCRLTPSAAPPAGSHGEVRAARQ